MLSRCEHTFETACAAAGRALITVVTLLTLLTLLMLSTPVAHAGVLLENQSLLHDGLLRWFDVYEPDGASTGALPLVILLHGGTQDKNTLRVGAPGEYFSLADREGFLLIVPNGSASGELGSVTGAAGHFNWNDCRGDAPDTLPETDDVGFIDALLDWTAGHYELDADRVYVTGASNGGMMAYRLAFELSDRLAGIASLIANLPAVSDCPLSQPTNPISVLIMNGTADPLVLWNGGPILGRGSVVSAHETRDFWRAFLQTDIASTHSLYPDVDPDDAGRIESDLYAGGLGGVELDFVTVEGGGHTLPSLLHPISPLAVPFFGPQNRDIESAEEVWRFLSRQRRVPEPAFGASLALFGVLLGWSARHRRARRSEEARERVG